VSLDGDETDFAIFGGVKGRKPAPDLGTSEALGLPFPFSPSFSIFSRNDTLLVTRPPPTVEDEGRRGFGLDLGLVVDTCLAAVGRGILEGEASICCCLVDGPCSSRKGDMGLEFPDSLTGVCGCAYPNCYSIHQCRVRITIRTVNKVSLSLLPCLNPFPAPTPLLIPGPIIRVAGAGVLESGVIGLFRWSSEWRGRSGG
jgi:hypothetical protein